MRADAITTFSISTCSTGNNADRRAAGRQGGGKVAARCRCRVRTPMPLRGACGAWHWRAVVGRYHLTRRTNKAESPFSRRTTSAVSTAAARCRCRVRTPMPLRGRAASGTGKLWSVSKEIRPRCLLRGAQQARSAPRRQGAAAGCARQCPYGGRAALGTCEHWLVSITAYAAHNKRGQRRERM